MRFSARRLAEIDAAKILYIRAGSHSRHRFIGIWVVVVDGRVFIRSWTLKPAGWYRTFLDDPHGTIKIGQRNVRIRAIPINGERLRDAVSRAYAAKYASAGSRKYVRGFRATRRRAATMELVSE